MTKEVWVFGRIGRSDEEEERNAIVLLAGLADDNAELLRAAANEMADEWASQAVRQLLLDAAQLAEIGA